MNTDVLIIVALTWCFTVVAALFLKDALDLERRRRRRAEAEIDGLAALIMRDFPGEILNGSACDVAGRLLAELSALRAAPGLSEYRKMVLRRSAPAVERGAGRRPATR